jgi:hypothetical protein
MPPSIESAEFFYQQVIGDGVGWQFGVVELLDYGLTPLGRIGSCHDGVAGSKVMRPVFPTVRYGKPPRRSACGDEGECPRSCAKHT